MTYHPAAYWNARARKFGPSYVGPEGDAIRSLEESVCFTAWLSDNLPDCDTLLDLGCGSGRLSAIMRIASDHYIGCDISEHGVLHARRLWPDLDFRVMTPHRIPVATASVDVLVATVVLQHVPSEDWWPLCSEVQRVLAPRGAACIIDRCYRAGSAAHMFPRSPEVMAQDMGLGIIGDVDDVAGHSAFVAVR